MNARALYFLSSASCFSSQFLETERGPVDGQYVVSSGAVDPAFFRTLGIPLVEGRPFDARDAAGGLPVAIVSRALADRLWPGADALGRRLREPPDGRWMTVVGVAANVRNGGFEQPLGEAAFYTPRAQTAPSWFESLVVRARPAPEQVVPALKAIVRQTMPDAPIEHVQTGYETISGENSRVRFATFLMIGFAVVALSLALVGVYGSFWCAVAQRRQEIGVRLALGASPADVMRMVLGTSARLTLAGLAIGLPLALGATRVLRSLIFEVSPNDPATFAVVAVFLAAAATAATYLPARRAASIDPAEALRRE